MIIYLKMKKFNTVIELMDYLEHHNLEVYGRDKKRSYLRNVYTKSDKEVVITNSSVWE